MAQMQYAAGMSLTWPYEALLAEAARRPCIVGTAGLRLFRIVLAPGCESAMHDGHRVPQVVSSKPNSN